jgi:ATP-binding cassette subfamily C protein
MKLLQMLRKLTAEIMATSPRKAVASIILTVALSVTEGISLLLLVPLLGLVGIEEPSSMPRVAGWFTWLFATVGLTPTLGGALVFFVSVNGLRALLTRWQSSVNAGVREDVTNSMRVRVYRAIARAEWKFIVTRRQSEFVHVLDNEISRVGAAAYQVIEMGIAVAVSLVYLALAFHFSPVMALIVLLCAALLAWVVRGSLRKARAVGSRASTARKNLHTAVSEHVASLKTAKSYGVTDRHEEIFLSLSHETRDVNLESTAGQTDLQQRLEFGSTVLLAIIVYLAYEVLWVSAAQLLVLLFVFARLMPRLVAVYRQVQGLAGVLPVLERVTELEQECLEAAEAVSSEDSDVSFDRSICFEKVSFTYLRRAKTPAVRDVDLEIEAGLTTAIVGPSGAGKSTLADLIIGLLSPTKGRIMVDGEELTPDRLEAWRRHISYVPQETFLFHDTVRANLVWALPEATDDEVWEALRLSAASEFVAALPHGLDTVVGERGVLVSGGERQRLSLARALLRRPRILVLDEATSSLDSENELRIQRAIEELHHRMTIVIITHRLSTIRKADMIHVLENGRLIQSGTWAELTLDSRDRFRQLCLAQGFGVSSVLDATVLDMDM